jgi:hypothetical protein
LTRRHTQFFRKQFRQLVGGLEFVCLNPPNGNPRTANALSEFLLRQVQGAPSLSQPLAKQG